MAGERSCNAMMIMTVVWWWLQCCQLWVEQIMRIRCDKRLYMRARASFCDSLAMSSLSLARWSWKPLTSRPIVICEIHNDVSTLTILTRIVIQIVVSDSKCNSLLMRLSYSFVLNRLKIALFYFWINNFFEQHRYFYLPLEVPRYLQVGKYSINNLVLYL